MTWFRGKKIIQQLILYSFLFLLLILILLPILLMVSNAFKTQSEMFKLPIRFLPQNPTLDNFKELTKTYPIGWITFNSFLIAFITSLSSVFFSAMAGYGLAKFKSTGLSVIFTLLLSAIMIPDFVRVIPLYLTMVQIGGQDTYWGVMVVNYLSIFGIFLMRQYATSIPNELLDAARIDGASELAILRKIVFPLLRSASVTLFAVKFMWGWNDFLWPLVMLRKPEMMTLPVALASLKGFQTTRYGPLMAGALLMVVPVAILFLFLQRYIVTGITSTGFK